MIEIGVVKKQLYDRASIVVTFKHLDTDVECEVLQSTTGDNTSYVLPSERTQVVCWLENGKNIALGALFSFEEPVPQRESDIYMKCGELECEIVGGKMSLKSSSNSFKTILKDILNTIKNITVSTPEGASGVPLPPTIKSIVQLDIDIDSLFKE